MKVTRKSSGKRILKATRKGAERVMEKAITEGGQVMGMLVAYDTGELESNNVAEFAGTSGLLENKTPYAKFVELGTYKMDAQPFFRPARDRVIQVIKREMKIRK